MSLFEVYKGSQGKYVRIGTLIALGVLLLWGMYWLGQQVLSGLEAVVISWPVQMSIQPLWIQTGACVIFGVVWALVALYLVNKPKYAEFMIMTESEMRKVNWPTRQVVMNSTKVVIVLTLMMAVLLFMVDYGFTVLFEWMGVLSN